MKFKKVYLILFIIPLLSFSAHKYYLSLTQIEFIEENKSVQIIINIFLDDIEKSLNDEYELDFNLSTKKEIKDVDSYFKFYLKQHLLMRINKAEQTIKYIGHEYEDDLVYFYLEIENVKSIKTLEISNKILINDFAKQQNLIKYKKGKENKSVLLTKEKHQTVLKF
jgi:hypothetical protein